MNPGSLEPPIWFTFIAWCVLLACAFVEPAHSQDTGFNSNQALLASSVRTATTNSADQLNQGWRGVHVLMNVTVAPGVDSITLNIQGKDPVSGVYYNILTGLAETTTGMKVYKVYPGIGTIANGSASDLLPEQWRVSVTHSAGTSFTYSVGYFYEK
jgi:hypothetical protein